MPIESRSLCFPLVSIFLCQVGFREKCDFQNLSPICYGWAAVGVDFQVGAWKLDGVYVDVVQCKVTVPHQAAPDCRIMF